MLFWLALALAQSLDEEAGFRGLALGESWAEAREASPRGWRVPWEPASPPDPEPELLSNAPCSGIGLASGGLSSDLRAADADLAWSVRFAPVVRWITGHVTVRENAVQGTRLDLDRDLGLRTEAGVDVEAAVEGPSLRFQMEVEELNGWGGHAARQTFNWNGTTFVVPSRIRDHSTSLWLLPMLTRKLLVSADRETWWGPAVGLEYPYVTVNVTTNRTKGSLEDWVHYLPYPALGMTGHLKLSDSFSLEGRLTGTYLPNVPVPFSEGGRLYVSSRPSLRLEVPLYYHLGPSADLSLAFTGETWSGRDHSVEDGNTLVLSSAGAWLGLTYRW
ncbi:MAG TPA: hypothetical protein VMU54_05510 [Planctomycetota bacterium]|nr:hypothetical protein [Planctomycetota bacterium]